MALKAMCMPILPGKKDKWLEMMKQINEGEGSQEFKASREEAGVHERSFLQETPHGDFVILTFEGDNPAESFAKIMSQTGPRKIETLRVWITLPPGLTEDQVQLFKRVVNNCPVKRNLEPSMTIDLIWC